jgi:hypothetical protein
MEDNDTECILNRITFTLEVNLFVSTQKKLVVVVAYNLNEFVRRSVRNI